MRTIGLGVASVILTLSLTCKAADRLIEFVETPMFERVVAAGKMPPVKSRIPVEPSILISDHQGFEPGRHGGTLKLLMGRKKDTRQLVVYGYARLIGYDRKFNFVPDLLKKFEVKEGRILLFTCVRGISGPMVTRLRPRIFAITGRILPTIKRCRPPVRRKYFWLTENSRSLT